MKALFVFFGLLNLAMAVWLYSSPPLDRVEEFAMFINGIMCGFYLRCWLTFDATKAAKNREVNA